MPSKRKESRRRAVLMYTDGACRDNPGIGGWGVVAEYHDHDATRCMARREWSGAEEFTTNNRMELTAVIEGLKALKRRCNVVVITDSNYVIQGATQWMPKWERNGWKTSEKEPVKNQHLWRALSEQVSRHNVGWEWVKGHSGDPGNERADALANLAIDDLIESGA